MSCESFLVGSFCIMRALSSESFIRAQSCPKSVPRREDSARCPNMLDLLFELGVISLSLNKTTVSLVVVVLAVISISRFDILQAVVFERDSAAEPADDTLATGYQFNSCL
jgi:hypothetical protein